EEIAALAEHLGEKRHEFEAVFTYRKRGQVSLREKANGDCVLFDRQKGCTVYPVRPRQCRTWPFWESNLKTPEDWARTERICPGSGEGELIPVEEITRRLNVIKM